MRKKSAMLMMLCFFLAACGTTPRRVTVEPGPSWMRPWQRPYTVDGTRYVPLLDAAGFREEGLASWYGAEEHGGPTSNGEVFDMYKPTAAHKTLPLGCSIRVTSKANGKSTVVRVNDRGPFVPGRIVDLSYRAARDLDFVGCGVTPVIIEVLPGASAKVDRGAAPDSGAVYTLQVAAYTDRETARLVAQRVGKELAWSAVRGVETERGHVYRVHAGRFRSRSDAETARSSLARNGYPDAFIVVP
jgi:rare lipoprotein A